MLHVYCRGWGENSVFFHEAAAGMATIAYLRVSKDSQDVKNQQLALLEFARQEHRDIDEFMELQVSSRRSPRERQLDVLLARRSQAIRSWLANYRSVV